MTAARLDGIMATYAVASWFETRGIAALLTMRVSDLILRSGLRRVSNDEATELEITPATRLRKSLVQCRVY